MKNMRNSLIIICKCYYGVINIILVTALIGAYIINKNERISVLVVPINEMTNNAYFVRPTRL